MPTSLPINSKTLVTSTNVVRIDQFLGFRTYL